MNPTKLPSILIGFFLYFVLTPSIACPPGYYESDICPFGKCMCFPKGNQELKYEYCVVQSTEAYPGMRHCKDCKSSASGDGGNFDCTLRFRGEWSYSGSCESNRDKCWPIK
jgi:hypothetical protein